MTQEELDADYYIKGYLSAKDNARDVVVWDDVPLRMAVTACRFRVLGKQDGICITFDNDADNTTASIAMTQSEALRLLEHIAERVSWSLRDRKAD